MQRLLALVVRTEAHETRAVLYAFLCHFILFGVYYVLRPVRDTMATVFGVDQLQLLFTGTFFIAMICAPLYSGIAARVRLERFVPGVFWFLLSNILVFYAAFHVLPQNRWLGAAYYWWLSVGNLIFISVFWTLMTDTFSDDQARRLFPFIQAGSSTGAIAGPLVTKMFVAQVGIDGLLLISAGGFLIVVLLVHLLIREKRRLREAATAQHTTLDHALPGNPFRGFGLLFRSPYLLGQAAFMVLMTWIATLLVFLQVDLISRSFATVEGRTVAFADVDLYVNITTAVVLIAGLRPVLQRFGVTASLVLTPVVMVATCIALVFAPTLAMVQAARGIQRVTQYAIARPSREILFTVIDQESRYKAKNVVDTVVYRLGDLSAAWISAGLRALGLGLAGGIAVGIAVTTVWTGVSVVLGRSYETIRRRQGAPDPA
jgi:AAA family ATP:ADP antiporter